MKEQPLDLPVVWIHGKHQVKYNEIALREDQADCAAWYMHETATFLMATEIKNAIIATIKDPINHKNNNIKNSFQISRFIRNAFTHHPFKPVWSIEKKYQNKIFKVKDIIKLSTVNIHGKPLAILKLCQFVRFNILKDEGKNPLDREMPIPKNHYIQQGNLILKKVKEIPKGAKPVNIKGKIADLGNGHKLIIS